VKHLVRALAGAGVVMATLVALPGLAVADPSDSMPVPGGPVFVPQAIHDLHVSAVCNPYNRFGPISVFDVTFDLTYPVDHVDLSVRKWNGDGTFGPSQTDPYFWQDTGTGVQWWWRSPLLQGWWQLRIEAPNPVGSPVVYVHPHLVNSCMPARA
jgi:hypothetical protein